jgi:hypothetical protein
MPMSTSGRTPEIPRAGAGKPPKRIVERRHRWKDLTRKKRDPDEIASGPLTKLAAPDGSPSAALSAASPGYYYTLGSPPSARVSLPLVTNQLRKLASSSPSHHVRAIHSLYSKRSGRQVKKGRREILAPPPSRSHAERGNEERNGLALAIICSGRPLAERAQ